MGFDDLLRHPRVAAARAFLRDHDAETVDEQVRLASIAAPTGAEAERAAYVATRFRSLGLSDVAVDEVGNVLGTWPGGAPPARPLVVAAHLDTVFPAGTPIPVRREGERIFAPGITDNARGLAAILALVRAAGAAGIATETPLVFAATVGEEGLGDLRGVKHLFRDRSPLRAAAAFVTLDGAGLTRIVHRAIGACRLRVTIAGLGGHSWGDRDLPNPVHALGLAITKLRAIEVSTGEEFGVNVGRVGGGTSVNSVPSEGWLELDLRSDDPETLGRLEAAARDAVGDAVREEKASAGKRSPLTSRVETIGARPSGSTPPDAAIVQAAVEATRRLGARPELAASSTDANVPIALGIPAVALGAGGAGGGVHTTGEWYDNRGGVLGIERALLALLAVAGVRADDQPAGLPPTTTEWSPTST